MDYQYQPDPFTELKRIAIEDYNELELRNKLDPDSLSDKERKRLKTLRERMSRECYNEFGT